MHIYFCAYFITRLSGDKTLWAKTMMPFTEISAFMDQRAGREELHVDYSWVAMKEEQNEPFSVTLRGVFHVFCTASVQWITECQDKQ